MGEYISKHFNQKFGVNLILGASMQVMKELVDYKIEPLTLTDDEKYKDDNLPPQKTGKYPEINFGFMPVKKIEDRDDYFCRTATFKKAEIPSANIYSSAHDLATVG